MFTMSCSSVACGIFVFCFLFFVCLGFRVDDVVDRCEDLTLMARFLVFSCFFFCFCIMATYVLDLICMKQICSLNIIVHRLMEA
jgi:hypothetical protein